MQLGAGPQHVSTMHSFVLTAPCILQESLKLTEQQKSELMQLRSWVLPKVGRLMQDRERISRSLQACTGRQSQQVWV